MRNYITASLQCRKQAVFDIGTVLFWGGSGMIQDEAELQEWFTAFLLKVNRKSSSSSL